MYIYISCIININIIRSKKYKKFLYVPQKIPYIEFIYMYAGWHPFDHVNIDHIFRVCRHWSCDIWRRRYAADIFTLFPSRSHFSLHIIFSTYHLMYSTLLSRSFPPSIAFFPSHSLLTIFSLFHLVIPIQ